MMHEEETLLLEPERTRTARGESFQVADLALGAAILDELWDSRDRVDSHFWEEGNLRRYMECWEETVPPLTGWYPVPVPGTATAWSAKNDPNPWGRHVSPATYRSGAEVTDNLRRPGKTRPPYLRGPAFDTARHTRRTSEPRV